MRELRRQMVLFGNFNNISFDSLEKLSDIKTKYNFQMDAAPDIVVPVNVPNGQQGKFNQNIISPIIPSIRPTFKSIENHIIVLFGSSRIHVEQVDGDSETYESFNNIALEIICELVEKLQVNVNRIAINGQFFIDSEETSKAIYQKIFCESDLYNSVSDEWNLHIVSKEEVDSLGCTVNKIIDFVKGGFLNQNGKQEDGLISVYDFNTIPGIDRTFTVDEIRIFNRVACIYRDNVLKASI